MSYDTLVQGRHARVAWAEVLDTREVAESFGAWTYVRANLRLGPEAYARLITMSDIHTVLDGKWLDASDRTARFAPGRTICFRFNLNPSALEDVFFMPDTQLILARRLPVQPDNPVLISHLLKEYPK